MAFKLNTVRCLDVTVMERSGGVTLGEGAKLFGDAVRNAVWDGHTKLPLDYRNVTYQDSSALAELVSAFTFRGAFLRGAVLEGAYLRSADLRQADLKGSDLLQSHLRGALLHEADIFGAQPEGATLLNVDLSGVKNAIRSQIALAVTDETTTLPVYDELTWHARAEDT